MEIGGSKPNHEPPNYQVFLSFRGPDTRQNLTDVLYHQLTQEGIIVFKDDEDQPLGAKISKIYDAIDHSKICIAIFSNGYASSKWCLNELVRMVESGKKIIPIFFDVTPDDVKLKTSLYLNAMRDVEGNQLEKWKEALKEVGGRSGLELKGIGHAEFCSSIVKEVMHFLEEKNKVIPEKYVGMDDQVEKVMNLVDAKAPGVKYIGIHGMAGIGKTTIAKVVFNRLHDKFEYSSFLEGIHDTLSKSGMLFLQKQLLKDLRSKLGSVDISTTDEGMKRVKKILSGKNVVLVLDDVDQIEEVRILTESIASCLNGSDSRVIITTRNVEVLRFLEMEGGDIIMSNYSKAITSRYEMKELNSDQALQLFSKHAFHKESPPFHHRDLSVKAVEAIGFLPLLLEIIGSHLSVKRMEEWEKQIKALRRKEVNQKLQMCLEPLDLKTKQIFLDIAIFPINEQINANYMWEACGFEPTVGLKELTSRSLVKIESGKLWMHDLLRVLGQEMVHMEDVTIPERRSRLMIHEKELYTIITGTETSKVEALRLVDDDQKSLVKYCLTREDLIPLRNLRYLAWSWLNVDGDLRRLFSKLRWLSWHHCPRDIKATKMNLVNLVILDLSYSDDITDEWCGWSNIKIGADLKVLNLTGCNSLTKIPDMSKFTCLERLILYGCTMLAELGPSMGSLKSLKHLDLRRCHSLKRLPDELCELGDALEEIFHTGQSQEASEPLTLPENFGNLHSLRVVEIESQNLGGGLPPTIGGLQKLEKLSLFKCNVSSRFPKSFIELRSLVFLDISGSTITELPDSIGNLAELKVLRMESTQIRKLPGTIGMLAKLEELDAKASKLAGELPSQLQNLTSLRILGLSFTCIQALPSLGKLSQLQKLDLFSCDELLELPELPTSLIVLDVSGDKISKVSDLPELNSLDNLWWACPKASWPWRGESSIMLLSRTAPPLLPSSLSRLTLFHLKMEENIPQLSHLKNLLYLILSNCSLEEQGFERLGLGELKSLRGFGMRGCELRRFSGQHLPKSLTALYLRSSTILEELVDLQHLENLKQLNLSGVIGGPRFRVVVPNLRLQEMKCLQHVVFDFCELSALSGNCLPENLELLELGRCVLAKKSSLVDLQNLKKLKSLLIFCCSPSGVAIKGLRQVKSLKHLLICGSSWKLTPYSCKFLPQNLEKLELWSFSKLKELDAAADLRHLKNLKSLVIRHCPKMTILSGEYLPKSLEYLEVGKSNNLEKLLHLPLLRNLKHLLAYGCHRLCLIEIESSPRLSVVDCPALKQYLLQENIKCDDDDVVGNYYQSPLSLMYSVMESIGVWSDWSDSDMSDWDEIETNKDNDMDACDEMEINEDILLSQ